MNKPNYVIDKPNYVINKPNYVTEVLINGWFSDYIRNFPSLT